MPVWGTFLSEPLWIVALVGRYPASKLIQRIPIPRLFHGAAMRWRRVSGLNPHFQGLSPGGGQVGYALLTRAPVSAPKGLSLDLHVLGLSLAFILSQDQTLHCNELSFLTCSRGRGSLIFIIYMCAPPRKLLSVRPGSPALFVCCFYRN